MTHLPDSDLRELEGRLETTAAAILAGGSIKFYAKPGLATDIRALIADLREARGRIAELEKLVYVPGLWRCAKCNFTLTQATLRASDGAVGLRDDPGEKCPNCSVPLWRVTERQAGNDMSDRAIEQLDRAVAAEARIKELEGKQ